MDRKVMDFARMAHIVAVCPSAGYCLAAQRLDCGACPVNPLKGERKGEEVEDDG